MHRILPIVLLATSAFAQVAPLPLTLGAAPVSFRARNAQTLVVPDQYPSVQSAMQAARAGDTIQVKPGRYVGGIVFKDGIKLIGTDAAETRLEAPDSLHQEAVIWVENCASGSIENLTVVGGGGTSDGIGLKDSRVAVLNCRIANARSGIAVLGSGSAPTLRGNRSSDGIAHGISFREGAGGQAENNVCDRNQLSGIAVMQRGSQPELKKNDCRANGKHGIEFSYEAGGVAEENNCVENRGLGMLVTTRATPALRRNLLRANGCGLCFNLASGGSAEYNSIEGNREYGVLVADGARPEIRGNDIRQNRRDGVQLVRQSLALLEGNTIEGNERNGIVISEPETKPILRSNWINTNREWGLIVVNGAEPDAGSSNRFRDNVLGTEKRR